MHPEMAGARVDHWRILKSAAATVFVAGASSDLVTIVRVQGASMRPTFEPDQGELALVDRRHLRRYDFSRGDVVVFRNPANHRRFLLNRLIALPGDWIQVPKTAEIRQIPEGHCWVEGDDANNSWDSRNYGPVPLGLMHGRVTYTVWPLHRLGPVDRKIPAGRVMPR